MNTEVRTIQEIVRIPYDADFSEEHIAKLIDSEIALERRLIDGSAVKVDSVSIVFYEVLESSGREHFFRSGKEYLEYVRLAGEARTKER